MLTDSLLTWEDGSLATDTRLNCQRKEDDGSNLVGIRNSTVLWKRKSKTAKSVYPISLTRVPERTSGLKLASGRAIWVVYSAVEMYWIQKNDEGQQAVIRNELEQRTPFYTYGRPSIHLARGVHSRFVLIGTHHDRPKRTKGRVRR